MLTATYPNQERRWSAPTGSPRSWSIAMAGRSRSFIRMAAWCRLPGKKRRNEKARGSKPPASFASRRCGVAQASLGTAWARCRRPHNRSFEAPSALRSETPGGDPGEFLVMSNIPLDFQRRLEQRWAARFLRPIPPSSTPTRQRPAEPVKIKRKTRPNRAASTARISPAS
jgi:hypothetical protein